MDHENETREEYRRHLQERIEQDVENDSSSGNGGNNYSGGGNDDGNHHPPYHHHHKGSFRWVWRLILIICVILVGAGGYEYHKLHSTAKGVFSSGDGKVDKKLAEGKPVSVLAMGTDVGALNRGNTGGNTDTLELITINPKKEKITMTSIPRDTLVKVNTKDGADYVKINAAYQIGGAKQTVKQVKELLGVPVDYYAVINMGVLKKVVNAVGGVEVDNPFAFTYEGHHFKKGKQHLTGNEALKYSRMRYQDPNNDYGRQKRQQQIMKSVIAKFKKSGSVSAINKILDAVKDGVKTNVPLDSISVLYGNYRNAMNTVKTYHFKGLDATIDGTSFQIASPKEINRISKIIRTNLGLKAKTVNNNETKLYRMQKDYDGYTHTTFTLPGGSEYNVAGSGSSSSSSTSTTSSSSYGSRRYNSTGSLSSSVGGYGYSSERSYSSGY